MSIKLFRAIFVTVSQSNHNICNMKTKTVLLCCAFTLTILCNCALGQDNINLVPLPKSVKVNNGHFTLNENTCIVCSDRFNGEYLACILKNATKFPMPVKSETDCNNAIVFHNSTTYNIPYEGYELTVLPDKIEIRSSSSAGEFYAIQTLLQLLPPTVYGNATGWEKWEIPAVEIVDSPRFGYRGFMLDVSRTFFSADVIYKILDWLAFHKINKFHWHLIDDNGWRVEIKKYPLLTQKGAWRGPDEVLPPAYGSGNKRYGGFYTQKEIKEIIKYAADRNIEIIPEIDMPGHSKSIVATYPQARCDISNYTESVNGEAFNAWCVGKAEKSNFKMLDDIIKEIANLFPSKTIHIGGDEVNFNIWKECPHCQALMKEKNIKSEPELQNYFMERVGKIIKKYGKNMAGWDEIIAVDNLPDNSVAYAWNSAKKGKEAAEKGINVVTQVCQYLYFDMKYTPLERGHNWASITNLEKVYSFDPVGTLGVNKEEEKYILGPQGGLWCELLNRPARFLEYQTWPRNAALAEIGWTEQSLRRWSDFNERLSDKHYERMFNMGIAFRVPYPDVVYENHKLKVELPYQWMVVRYTTDGSEPTCNSPVYTGDIVTYEPQNFRFASFYKDILKSITVKASNLETEYLTPEVKVTASYDVNPKFPLSNLEDYAFKTYSRSKQSINKGDWVLYSFTQPVECSKITIEVGIPNITVYGLTDGHVEYSYDGISFVRGDNFTDNIAIIKPLKAVKAVKIVADGYSDGNNLSVQDLKIE